jgi:hypothetical protein
MCTMELSRYTNVHNGIEDLILMCLMGLMEDINVHISFENVILMCTIEKLGFRGTHCILVSKIGYPCVQW